MGDVIDDLKAWPANRLPLPVEQRSHKSDEVREPVKQEVVVPDNDFFPKGRVVEYFPYQGYGYIKDVVGRKIYFNIGELRFVGPKGKDSISVDSIVGYDVSWTTNGLHISQIKVY